MFELIRDGHVLIIISAVGSLMTCFSLLFALHVADVRQRRAYAGDIEAGLKIILPCYRPLFFGLALFFLALCGGQILSLFKEYDIFHVYFVLQYHSLSLTTAYMISPVLLIQHSVSMIAFWRTSATIFPYWLIMTLLWMGSWRELLKGRTQATFLTIQTVLIILAFLPPFCLSLAILRRYIVTRVQLASQSNRCSSEYLFFYSIIFFGFNCFTVFRPRLGRKEAANVSICLVSVTLLWNCLFTLSLHRSLLADTKFWRGIGTHNKTGIVSTSRDTSLQLPKPSMDVSIASTSFQEMMTHVGKIVIDFAFLEVKQQIGMGATSKVYSGVYKGIQVAIKVSTPTEITVEVIDVFVKEGLLSTNLQHKNIVKFFGVCVRPPQIAMVMELCTHGSLKSSILKHPQDWTAMKRLTACLSAARAVNYIHYEGYIHRDIKTENFFLTEKDEVKLGDFGESRKEEISRDSLGGRRMTILGTIAYMAPELVAAAKFYTTAVDIFALAITFWEVWTGQTAYAANTQFEVYKMVEDGIRPDLTTIEAPVGLIQLLNDAWHNNPDLRPSAEEICQRLETIIISLGGEVEPDQFGGGGPSQNVSVNSNTSSLFTGERVRGVVNSLRRLGSTNSQSPQKSGTTTPSSPLSSIHPNSVGIHEKLISEEMKSGMMTPRESMGYNSSFNNGTTTMAGSVGSHSFDIENKSPLHGTK